MTQPDPAGWALTLLIGDRVRLKPDTTATMDMGILLGRGVAMCVHPYAAWRTRSARGRMVVVASYVAAAYGFVLTFLLLAS